MALFLQDTCTEIIFILSFVILLTTNFIHNRYKYWRKKGVPYIAPKFPLGNSNTFLPKGFSVGTLSKTFYDELKRRGHKFGGVYLVFEPNIVIVDPDYVKDILCTDFQYFVDRGTYYNEKDNPISAHLFAVDGIEWRNLRVKLTPTFTSGKMKMMFRTVVECCNYMIESMEKNLDHDVEIKEFLGRFTTDVIGSCAFGIECNSFKHPDAEFRRMGKKIFEYKLPRSIQAFFMMNLPKFSKRLGLRPFPQELQSFFRRIVTETIQMREAHNIRRNDFLQLLMDLRTTTDMHLDVIVAQVFLFFIAGFETSSTAMTFALYELAKNADIQKKLRAEINEVLEKHDGQITYESLSEMKYLGQVLDETLRMYPPLVTLNRRCNKNYTLRNTDIVIEKGTSLLISTLGLHRDPDYYLEPDKFDPERFNEENKKSRHPSVFLPFGDGPRNCIGLRFGLMQSKIGIVTVLKKFSLTVSPTTKKVEFNPYVFLLNSKDKVYLRLQKI